MQIVLEAAGTMVDCRSKTGRDQHNRQWSRRYLLPDTVRTSNMKKILRTEVDEKSVGNLGALTLTTF